MNNMGNSQHTSNSYNGDTIGRDSPSALLDMLAEVASQTLHSEEKRIKSMLASQNKSKAASTKRKESCFTVSQLLSMPVSHLVKQFTIFTSDELKRQYSYTCALLPSCQQKYTSFASEEKARVSIKNHLEEHLEYLKADKEAYDTFTAKSINHKNLKINLQSKKSRMLQTKKPQETLNKENKDVISEKSTNYLCKILLNNINIKENEKQRCFQKSENKETYNPELKNCEQMDVKVLGDHSYFERLDDKISNNKKISSSVTSTNVLNDATREEKIVLMVVGTDSVHMKEYSHVNEKLAEKTTSQNCSDDIRIKSTETSTTSKPKGKAKFIGTSKEEREMALAYMERIKKKGNPTGSNLQCRICDPPRSFTAPTTLVSHYRSHAGIKPYECRICRAVFTRRHSLKYHMLIHQNQTRFTCADCGKKFRHPSHFREHQRRHTGEAPFGCDDCGQRFKTRNTYKRHLKTRHGKILTTIGEVLNLSEEDFQKVRTGRRRKEVCAPLQTTVNDMSNTVMALEKQDDEQIAMNIIEECIIKENINDINENWETKSTMQVIDKCFEGFEMCSESQLNKTDGIETEVTVNCRYPNRNDSNIRMECINNVQNNLLQVKNSFYDNSKIINNEEKHVYQHNINDQNKINDCNNEMKYEYSKINNNEVFKTEECQNMAKCKVNLDFSKGQDRNHLCMLQESTHDYHKVEYNSDKQEKSITYMHLRTEQVESTSSNDDQSHNDTHAIITQNDSVNERSEICAINFNSKNKDCATNNVIFCSQVTNANVDILQTINKVGEEMQQKQDNLLQKNEYLSEPNTTELIKNINVFLKDSIETDQKIDRQQTNRYLYVQPEPNKIIAQNKCISIPVHQIKLHYNQENQLKAENCGKIRILNGNIRAINIKQSDKQNAILLITSDNLKNGIFQIDKNNSTVVKNLKR